MGVSLRVPGVTPNPIQDQEWRQEVGYIYSGNLVVVPAAPDFTVASVQMGSKATNPVCAGSTFIGW